MTTRHTSTLRDFMRALFRHWRTILLTTAATVAAAALWLGLRTPLYESRAEVLVHASPELGTGSENAHTELELLKATRLTSADLETDDLRARVLRAFGAGTEEQALGALHRGLRVDAAEGSGVLRAGFRASDPRVAADLSNRLVERYLERRAGVLDPSRTRAFYDEQIAQQGTRLQALESELDARWTGDDLADLDAKKQLLLAELSALDLRRREAEEERERLLEARRGVARRIEQRGGWLETPEAAAGAAALATLDRLYFELAADRARFAEAYLGDARPLRRFDRQLAELREQKGRQLLATLDARERDAKRRGQSLAAELARKRVALDALNARALDLLRLEREHAFAESTYLLYRRKAEGLRLEGELVARGLGGVSLLRAAQPATDPVSVGAVPVLLLAALVGLVLGGLQALVRQALDHTFQEPERVANELALPVLAAVPDAREEARAVAAG